jgi:hypothetical protein
MLPMPGDFDFCPVPPRRTPRSVRDKSGKAPDFPGHENLMISATTVPARAKNARPTVSKAEGKNKTRKAGPAVLPMAALV